VLELNRLCCENLPNRASFLVGHSLRLLPRNRIIVSFADCAQGHVGTVYQATNFLYTGLSAKRTNWVIAGSEHLHGQTVADSMRGVPNRAAAMRAKYGAAFSLQPRSRKHRYVTFIGERDWKKGALSALRYPILPYPKKNV
jgi:hypothetical protein